jgi:large subunit ribosomal protein L5
MTFIDFYKTECVPQLKEQFGYKNPMQVPRLEKIVLSSCRKEAVSDVKVLDRVSQELATISGQKPIIRRARKSIASFKLREGMPIACMVTLRQRLMYEFYNRLVNVALPSTRDFRGVSPRGFDGRGNYTLGLQEQIIFPEIPYDKVDQIRGMNVTIVTTAQTDEEGRALLKVLGMPFRER